MAPSSSPQPESHSSDSEDSLSLPTPPDGGWGWAVVVASFMVHFIADGCAFSFGVLYVELLDYFKESKGKTAWVGSLFVSVPLLTGPIASALTNKYGCRAVTIVGAAIAGVGFVASSFASSIEQLCFTFGIIAGFGLSMVYVPAVVIVAYYFEKRRAFATGLAVAGSGIGTFVFAPLTECLIEWYTWKGTVLILGAIMLNMIPCGAVFRPLTEKRRGHKNASKQLSLESRLSRKSSSSGQEDLKVVGSRSGGPVTPEGRVLLDQPIIHSLVQFPTYLQKEVVAVSPDLLRDLDKSGKTLQDLLADPDFVDRYCATQSLTDMSQVSAGPVSPDSQLPGGPHVNGSVRTASADDATASTSRASPTVATNGDVRGLLLRRQLLWQKGAAGRHLNTHPSGQAWPMQRKDIFYRGSLVRPGLQTRAMSCPDIVMRSHRSSESNLSGRAAGLLKLLHFSHEVKLVLMEMMDMAILRSSVFVYFCASCMLLYLWYDVPYVYCPDKAIEMGMSETAASSLVAIIGITSTVGQVVVGYIGDRPCVDALHLYNALTSVAGVATILVPLLKTYAGLAAYAAAYGFFISGNYALTTIILVELLGMEKLTNAYGLAMLSEGLSNLVGPPLAGE